MKNQNGSTAKHPFALRPASREEAGLFYSDEEQDDVLGTVGHVRMDFGSGGKQFWSTWWPHNGDQLNTPEFKEELQMIVDALRQDGPLQSLSAMNSYCWHHGGEISKNDRIYGYIAETAHYRFCLRCTPRPGEYQGYLYCYDLRQQRMQQQDHLVGRVTYASGEQQEFTDPQEYLRTIREELPYNDCAYIRNLYKDFYIIAFRRDNPLAKKQGAEYKELLITNYDPRPFMTSQLTLFDAPAVKLEMELVHIPRRPLKIIKF